MDSRDFAEVLEIGASRNGTNLRVWQTRLTKC